MRSVAMAQGHLHWLARSGTTADVPAVCDLRWPVRLCLLCALASGSPHAPSFQVRSDLSGMKLRLRTHSKPPGPGRGAGLQGGQHGDGGMARDPRPFVAAVPSCRLQRDARGLWRGLDVRGGGVWRVHRHCIWYGVWCTWPTRCGWGWASIKERSQWWELKKRRAGGAGGAVVRQQRGLRGREFALLRQGGGSATASAFLARGHR